MNIGVIVDNEFNADVRVRKEVDILLNHGHKINVLCFGYDNTKYPDIKDVNVHRILIKRKRKNILFFFQNTMPFYESLWKREIKKFIIYNLIDILHVHDLYMSKAAYMGVKSSKRNIKIHLDLHENFPIAIKSYNWTKGFIKTFLARPNDWRKKEAIYLKYANKIVVLSESFKAHLLNKYSFLSKKNVIVFPNIIDLRLFESFKINTDIKRTGRVTLMYFGAVAERRGIFDTLNVLQKAIKINSNIDLLIIGPIDKADKKLFFRELTKKSLKNHVEYIPWIELKELPTYMNISDILLSPLKKNEQHESGIANKIFQYLYGKKPLIVSDCRPQKELVDSFKCGLSYSTQAEYLNCILVLAKDEQLRNELGNNGFNKLYETFDNDGYEQKLLELYKN